MTGIYLLRKDFYLFQLCNSRNPVENLFTQILHFYRKYQI